MASEREPLRNPEIPARPHEHSVEMSRILLGNDIEGTASNHTIGTEIHDAVYKAFEAGSIDDRKHYWEKRDVGNWGEQMLVWLQGEDGNGGLSGWIREQNKLANEPGGEALKSMLSIVGFSVDDEGRKTLLDAGHPLTEIVERINESLKAVGKNPLDTNSLHNDVLSALSFYSICLDTNNTGVSLAKQTKYMIDYLIGGASYDLPQQIPQGEEAEYQTRIFKRLELIAPLFRTTGLDAQYGLSAMVAAKVHAATKIGDVEAADHTNLNEADKRAMEFFDKYKHNIEQEKGDEDTSYPIKDIMEMVSTPPAREEDSKGYWIGDVLPPAEVVLAELRSRDGGLKNLERIEPFWVAHPDAGRAQQGHMLTNFKPATDFRPKDNPDSRFAKLEALTEDDSGLLALAGIAASTPEKQAKLFEILGRVTLELYKNNPNLLEEFLDAQVDKDPQKLSAWAVFVGNDYNSTPYLRALNQEERALLSEAGIDTSLSYEVQEKQMTAKAQADSRFADSLREIQEERLRYLLSPLSNADSQDKLIAFSVQEHNGQSILVPDLKKTVDEWKHRLDSGELEKALTSGRLDLAQIRQIEFLSHAVDVVRLVNWLQGRGQKNGSNPASDGADPATPIRLESRQSLGVTKVSPEDPAHEYFDKETSYSDGTVDRAGKAEPLDGVKERQIAKEYAVTYLDLRFGIVITLRDMAEGKATIQDLNNYLTQFGAGEVTEEDIKSIALNTNSEEKFINAKFGEVLSKKISVDTRSYINMINGSPLQRAVETEVRQYVLDKAPQIIQDYYDQDVRNLLGLEKRELTKENLQKLVMLPLKDGHVLTAEDQANIDYILSFPTYIDQLDILSRVIQERGSSRE